MGGGGRGGGGGGKVLVPVAGVITHVNDVTLTGDAGALERY